MKTELIKLVKQEVEKLGSASKVAIKLGISDSALSTWLSGKYGAGEHKLNNTIAIALGYSGSLWSIAQTRDIKMLHYSFEQSKLRGMFMGVSYPAGSGKTASIDSYCKGKKDVYIVKAREWTGKMFADEIIRILGIKKESGYTTMDRKISIICEYFKERRDRRPQLLIDEADKLRPSALRILIPLYNECEDILSVVISGTENLRKEIKRGVEYSRKGYDEIDSRFGRYYHGLIGAMKSDVKLICEANGISEADTIDAIWKECPKIHKNIENRDVEVVVDMRLLKRLIQREFI